MRTHAGTGLLGVLAVAALMTGAACGSGGAEPQAPAKAEAPALSDPGTAAPGGRVTADAPLHDYGTVVAGEAVKHTFTVRNTGDGVLNILSARGG